MTILDGKVLSAKMRADFKKKVEEFKSLTGRPPGLAVVLVGDDPPSQVYVKNKGLACKEIGLNSVEVKKPVGLTPVELKDILYELSSSKDVDGIIVQMPLPPQFNQREVLTWLTPKKDADGLTTENLGLVMEGRPRVAPCTPSGVMKLLESQNISVQGKNCVVVGRSLIVGKPMALLLQNANATVTMCHSQTKNLHDWIKKADVTVVAAGRKHLFKATDFAKGSVVVDVGMHRVVAPDGKISWHGDVDLSQAQNHLSAWTPVPGGVGPMTITMLIGNTIDLAFASLKP